MYKYYSELENLREFKTFLVRENLSKEQDLFIHNISFSDNLLKRLGNLFPKLNKIDEWIMALNEDLISKVPEHKFLSYDATFFQWREERYFESHYDLRENISLTSWNLQCVLRDIDSSIHDLVEFYPFYKKFLLSTQKEIQMVLNEIEIKSTVKIPPKSDRVIVEWPNSWYITPNGYLYNTGGAGGHKEGNLVYPFYYDICNLLKQNKRVPDKNHYNHIRDILKRGYVTYGEFQYYSHLMYRFPTVITPEVIDDIKRYKSILEMSGDEYKKMITSSEFEWPQPERSYQKNLITLIIGHLAAETSLYSSFVRMSESCHKKELITQLRQLTRNDIRDVLVRFCGFHKVESIVDNTITTCSLNGITEFSEYLKRGWNLHIIPRIVYDECMDKLSEMDFSSYFVSKHLDSELAKYEGKGKILIKDKWVN